MGFLPKLLKHPWALVLQGSSQSLRIWFWKLQWMFSWWTGAHLALWAGLYVLWLKESWGHLPCSSGFALLKTLNRVYKWTQYWTVRHRRSLSPWKARWGRCVWAYWQHIWDQMPKRRFSRKVNNPQRFYCHETEGKMTWPCLHIRHEMPGFQGCANA